MKEYRLISLIAAVWMAIALSHAQDVPCTGSQYATDAAFFRTYASALSSDATASKKKAIVKARSAISLQINARGEEAARSQTRINGADKARLAELIQIATRQKAAALKVVCEQSGQAGGKYKTHLVVEIAKADVLAEILLQVKSDDSLKELFEEEKFKQAF